MSDSAKGPRRRIALALQGGGAHGAFTWGALDRLLALDADIVAVSGTSAGALNGAALVSGYRAEGADGARRALERFWDATARRSPLGAFDIPVEWPAAPFVDAWLSRILEFSKVIGRYVAPFLPGSNDMQALRSVVTETLDIEGLADPATIPLHVAATRVRDGTARVFTGGAITIDALMASACLPDLFAAVEIDGEIYWDGGYSANPALGPLLEPALDATDLVIIQVTPFCAEPTLDTLPAILRRVTDINFNACLMRDLVALEATAAQRAAEGRAIRIHLIPAPHALTTRGSASKVDTRASSLADLRRMGHAHMDGWLEENFAPAD